MFAGSIERKKIRDAEAAKRRAEIAASKREKEKRAAERRANLLKTQAENRAEQARKSALRRNRSAQNSEDASTGFKKFLNENILGTKTQLKSGGKVKKGYKKGCSVKKGYKSGGKVRGAGCVTKGVRPCKMR